MMQHITASTPERALEALTRQVALQDEGNVKGGGGVQAYDLLIEADTSTYDYDVAKSWVTKQRWSMLTKQYLNEGAFEGWLDLISAKLTKRRSHGVAFLRSQIVKPRVTTGKPARQWGSCMIGWSFRVFPTPALVMHSRSTYLGFLAPLDLGVAAILADEAGQVVGLEPGEIKFVWHLDQATFHTFRSMPWWYLDDKHKAQMLKGKSMAAKNARHILERFAKMDDEDRPYSSMAYAQERRFRMKWHEAEGINPGLFLLPGEKPLPKNKTVMINDLPLTMTTPDDEEVERGFDGGDSD